MALAAGMTAARATWTWILSAVTLQLASWIATPAAAQEFSYNGFVDGRLVAPSNQVSWDRGGLGKLRFSGGANRDAEPVFDEAAVDAKLQFGSEIAALTTLRVEPTQRTFVDMLEGYVRYRPSSDGQTQWTAKAGAFFPPVSLENESTAWTSPWTLTPSAINTWVGEELRTIGGEAAYEWRYGSGALAATGSVFGWNGPAGSLLSNRGWALGDRPTGLFDKIRQPDVVARRLGLTPPEETEPFVQIGARPGWYAGAGWRDDDLGRVRVLHYDNEANPGTQRSREAGWHTVFDSLGAELDLGEIVLLGQAMAGSTETDATAGYKTLTRFKSAYLLAGRYFGKWTLAGRVEFFGTHEEDMSEHGHAETLAVSWRPRHMLRLTAEALRVDSYRRDRINAGLAPRAIENQVQLSARLFF